LSENRNRSEGKLDLGLFFAFLRRIVALFEEKKREIAQIQLFCNRFSILGQAPRAPTVGAAFINGVTVNCKLRLKGPTVGDMSIS